MIDFSWFKQRIQHEGWRPLIISLRCALAAFGAVETCRFLNLPFPIYALVAAIMVTEYHGEETRRQCMIRFVGNSLGIIVGGVLGSFLGDGGWVIGLATFCLVLACYCFSLPITAKYAGFVAALTVMDHSARPWVYGRDRIIETLIGILFAVVMSLVIPVPKGHGQLTPNAE